MTTSTTGLTSAVQEAVEELRATFPDAEIIVDPDGEGGAWVKVDAVKLGRQWRQSSTWIAFHITYPYPDADVYPHFARADLSRADGEPLGEGLAAGTWGRAAEPATQLSRRSNRLNPATDTAALKLLKVLKWLNSK